VSSLSQFGQKGGALGFPGIEAAKVEHGHLTTGFTGAHSL
jgi:hypothetical protein